MWGVRGEKEENDEKRRMMKKRFGTEFVLQLVSREKWIMNND